MSGGNWAGTPIAERFPLLNAQTLPATELIRWNTAEPRFALSYALSDSGRTILRAGASRYYHHLPSFGLFVSNPAFPLNYVTLWFDRNNDDLFQIGEDGRLLFSFGGQLNPVDEDIRRPHTNEFMVGVSHELNEALAQLEEPNVEAGRVARVLEKGYRLRDRLLRPARVMVSKGSASTDPD